MLFSQVIPPAPSHTESQSLFSMFPLLPLYHSPAMFLLSGHGAQLRAWPTSPASHFPRSYTDAEGTQHFVLSYCLVLISCCTFLTTPLHSDRHTNTSSPAQNMPLVLPSSPKQQQQKQNHLTPDHSLAPSETTANILVILTASHSHYNHI